MKSRYDLQSVLSTAGKLLCKRTALKSCTNIEILWYRYYYYYYHYYKTRLLVYSSKCNSLKE